MGCSVVFTSVSVVMSLGGMVDDVVIAVVLSVVVGRDGCSNSC